MAEEPVGGRNTGTGTGKSAAPSGDAAQEDRIPVSEPPEAELDEGGEGTGRESAEPEQATQDEGRDEGQDEQERTEPAGTGAASAQKPAEAGFDVFAAPAKPEPIPVSEAPDLEAEAAEAEAEAAEADGAGPAPEAEIGPEPEPEAEVEPEPEAEIGPEPEVEADDQLTTVVNIPASRRSADETSSDPDVRADADEDGAADDGVDFEDDDDDAAATMFVPTVSVRGVTGGVSAAQAEFEETVGVPSAEADETTLIPKVTPEKPTESTTVMPSVPSPSSDMARRPYGAAPSGYGSARQEWGHDNLPDAQETRVQPLIPGPAVAGGSKPPKKKSGYQPPEFHAVDPTRSELPPPQNFKLDRRELDEEEDGGRHLGRRAVLAGGAVVVAGAGALFATGKVKLPGTQPKMPPTVGFAPATNSGASAATQTGTAFLTAWQNNQFKVAANLTDNPTEALATLEAYHKSLGVLGITMNPNAANGVGWMTFAINTQAGSPMGVWQYESGFATYAKQIDGFTRWFVQWSPQIVYTSLKKGYALQIKHTPASVKGLVDRHGAAIDAAAHPSLAGIITTLTKQAKVTGATDGQDIIMVDGAGKQLATVTTLTPPIDNGTVTTTLDMKVQAALESAVKFRENSSMVAIQPSTGYILGVANNTGSQYVDTALLGTRAPGSTFKIITSTALLHNGLTTTSSTVPCPPTISFGTTVLHNSEGESSAGDSYLLDFAASCNNAFSSFWDKGVTKNMLADTAKTFFGLNQKWDIGLGEEAQYMIVPGDLSEAGLAEALVGQDTILSNPLAMCSVAATVANGSFKQPVLLPKYKQIAATPLGSKLQGDLKDLMKSVMTEGTAAGIFPNNGHFYGKTGTAEVSKTQNDSWFVCFHDEADIALCALAVLGGYGASVAAPECHTAFKKLGYA